MALSAAGVASNERCLAAVSGGPDSLLMLHLLADVGLGSDPGPGAVVATVNHALRPESDGEVALVRAACVGLGLEFHELDGRLPEEAGASVEDAARRVRYRRLAELARELGLRTVLTAHQADDQAETLLWRLLSGAPAATLRGMRTVRSLGDDPAAGELRLVRPMLDWTRAEVEEAVARRGLEPCVDASNHDPRFLRTRLRRVMDELTAINPRATEALAAAASELGGLLDVVGDAERRLLAELGLHCDDWGPPRSELRVPIGPLQRARPAVREAALRRLLQRLGASSGRRAVARLAELCVGSEDGAEGRIEARADRRTLAGAEAERRGAELRIRARREPSKPSRAAEPGSVGADSESAVILPIPGSVAFRGTRYHVRRLPRSEAPEPDLNPGRLALLDVRIGAPLMIRRRRPGDRLRPLGQSSGEQTVGRLMKSRGIPADRRGEIDVLLAGEQIVWVIGVEIDDRARVREDTEDVLEIRLAADEMDPQSTPF